MKTFYTVDYNGIGFNGTQTKWFDNMADAKEFSKGDYKDNPATHNIKNPAKIKEIENLIKEQEYDR